MAHFLVVGGTKGLGLAFAKEMASKRHVVSVVGRSKPVMKGSPGNLTWHKADIAKQATLRKTLTSIVKENGRLHYITFFQRYRGTGEKWKGELETSLTATRNVINEAISLFDENASDRAIVVFSSLASSFIVSEQPDSYHVAKAGLDQLVRYYAVNLGRKGVRVNAIRTGTIVKEESRRLYAEHNELEGLYKRIIPLQRMGTAEDMIGVLSFLCSSASSFVTGQCLVADGGMSLVGHESLARSIAGISIKKTAQP